MKWTFGEELRNVLRVNLAAGYLQSRRYAESAAILESILPDTLPRETVRLAYWINYCEAFFQMGKVDRFEEVYSEHQPLFAKYEEDPTYATARHQIQQMFPSLS